VSKLKTRNDKSGFTLVEAMVGMAIIAFVIVGILGTFSHQQMAAKKSSGKNTAVILAEMKLEEYLKYSSSQLTGELAKSPIVEYAVQKEANFQFYTADNDPKFRNQFRRTTTLSQDLLGQMITIRVVVDYGFTGTAAGAETYPFRIILSTVRGL
jgi:prepilin-type N-terminal cleavage/methylation domain-containing protein